MATLSAAEQMERLQLSDEDTEDLWNSPSSKKHKKTQSRKSAQESSSKPEPSHARGDSIYEREEAREAALREELQNVRNINEVIEGVLESLDRAKGNMETVSRTVNSASILLNTWTRILSQAEHNQRLILNPNWQGASQDIIDMENEAARKQQEAERRELELQQRREAAARKAEEDKKKAETAASRGARGTSRGRVRGVPGRIPSTSTSHSRIGSTSTTSGIARPGSAATTRRPVSGIPKGTSGIARGRGRA